MPARRRGRGEAPACGAAGHGGRAHRRRGRFLANGRAHRRRGGFLADACATADRRRGTVTVSPPTAAEAVSSPMSTT